jgi:ADP-ribose pyrophosphatase YjhB (NUDIX family)
MRIGASAVVTNELGQALLIRRDDTRLLAPPGGGVEAGELPTACIAREVREETGLIVLPVRLVALFFWDIEPDGALSLVFRCLQRGGQLQTSPESLQVGFFSTNPLPADIFSIHRERLERGLRHAGGPPYWGRHRVSPSVRAGRFLLSAVVYPFKDLRRRRRQAPPYQPPPNWSVSAFVVIRNEQGAVLWRRAGSAWALPGGSARPQEAPWETAARQAQETAGVAARLTDLSGVYVDGDTNQMRFVFTAEVEKEVAVSGGYFSYGQEPAGCSPQAVEWVHDAGSGQETTIFRRQKAAP